MASIQTMRNNVTRIRRSAARFRLAVAVALVLVAVAVGGARGWLVASVHGQDLRKFNQFVQTSNSPSIILLREGRDLVDGEEWTKAAEKFESFIAAYPKDKDVDVALYWLAYSLKQQGKFREAAGQLSRLLKDYPKSVWSEEATAMLTEIAPQIGDRRTIDESLNKNDEEIRIVALQSLFESSPERAVVYVTDILKPGSKASRSFKETAVSLLGSHGGQKAVPLLLDIARNQTDRELRVTAFRRLAEEDGEALVEDLIRLYDAERDLEVRENYLHAFESMDGARARTKLLEVARSSAENAELRKTAIRVLGNKEEAGAFDELARLYETETNREIKEQILISLSDMDDPRAQSRLLDIARNPSGDAELRKFAIRRIGDHEGEASVDALLKIYDAEQDVEVKRDILQALSNNESPRALARIVEVARAGTNAELRRTAIRLIRDADEAHAVERLAALYDSEREVDIKSDILRALGDTKQKSAVRKLIDVARRDPNVELRKQAISQLGQSEDPDAVRFLEEILKP